MRVAAALLLLATLTGAAPVCDAVWRDAARARDVPVKIRLPEGTGRVPVVIYSPGMGGTTSGGGLWGAAWSNAGLAVVHVQHPGSDDAVYKGAKDAADRRARVAAAATGAQLAARVGDVGFVVDELGSRRREGACDLGRLDLSRLGIAGHSMGSWVAQALAGQRFDGSAGMADRRFVAAIGFSPSPLSAGTPSASFGGITIPFFSITGSEDGVPPARPDATPERRALQHAQALTERAAPYVGMPPGQKYLLVLDGADHMAFAGNAARAAANPHIAEVTLAASTAFWGATLQGKAADKAFLADGLARLLAPADRLSSK